MSDYKPPRFVRRTVIVIVFLPLMVLWLIDAFFVDGRDAAVSGWREARLGMAEEWRQA